VHINANSIAVSVNAGPFHVRADTQRLIHHIKRRIRRHSHPDFCNLWAPNDC